MKHLKFVSFSALNLSGDSILIAYTVSIKTTKQNVGNINGSLLLLLYIVVVLIVGHFVKKKNLFGNANVKLFKLQVLCVILI